MGESIAPSHKYAAAQIPHSIPCSTANSSPITAITQIRIAIRFDNLRPRVSSRTRTLPPTKAIITTAAAWIAVVNTMSDKPHCQPEWSKISIECAPQTELHIRETGSDRDEQANFQSWRHCAKGMPFDARHFDPLANLARATDGSKHTIRCPCDQRGITRPAVVSPSDLSFGHKASPNVGRGMSRAIPRLWQISANATSKCGT